MAGKSVRLGEYVFATKKEAKELYSDILNGTDLEQNLEGSDYDYVMALLLSHPRAVEKIGCGVESIKVSTGYTYANRCFHVVRKDGTVEDFSIGKCINGDHSEFHKFCVACRKSVEADVRAYKRRFFEENADACGLIKCQSTKQLISFDEAHADHREPFTFSSMVHYFYKAKGIDLSAVKYETDGKYGNEFADPGLVDSFRQWHKDNAKLRVVDGKTNIGKGYLGRVKSTKADGGV